MSEVRSHYPIYLLHGDGALSDPVVGGGEVVVDEVGRVLVRSCTTLVLNTMYFNQS